MIIDFENREGDICICQFVVNFLFEGLAINTVQLPNFELHDQSSNLRTK